MKRLYYCVFVIGLSVLIGCGGNRTSDPAVNEKATVAVKDETTSVIEETNQKKEETTPEPESHKAKEETTSNDVNEKKNLDKKEACLKEAQDDIDDIGGYSPKALRLQLEFHGYTSSEIDYALANVKVDWGVQAKQYCKDLLNMDYTRQEAFSELVGWGFTTEEAKAAMAAVYY